MMLKHYISPPQNPLAIAAHFPRKTVECISKLTTVTEHACVPDITFIEFETVYARAMLYSKTIKENRTKQKIANNDQSSPGLFDRIFKNFDFFVLKVKYTRIHRQYRFGERKKIIYSVYYCNVDKENDIVSVN